MQILKNLILCFVCSHSSCFENLQLFYSLKNGVHVSKFRFEFPKLRAEIGRKFLLKSNAITVPDGQLPIPKNIAIHVTKSAESSLRKQHPWLFDQDITKASRSGSAGDIAIIFGADNNFLAAGLFDPYGPIRVRALQHNRPRQINRALIIELIGTSIRKRDHIIPANTNGFRLINGENDGLPAMVADIYADTVVIKLYSACWASWLPAIEDGLQQHAPAHMRRVVLLSRHLQALGPDALGGLEHGALLKGQPLSGALIFQESGLQFEVDPLRGQKTGFFLDQRDNRRRVEALARGARVLNVFSYTGGFSLYAARGGATEVTSVDVSRPAMEAAQRNWELNRAGHAGVRRAAHHAVVADAFEAMREMRRAGRRFDLVVVDPPSMANKASLRHVAISKSRPAQFG